MLVPCDFATVFAHLDFLKKLLSGKGSCELYKKSFVPSLLTSLVIDEVALSPLQDSRGMQVGASFSMLHFPHSLTQFFPLIC